VEVPEMAETHLEKTLSELQAQRDQKAAELAKLDSAIEAIRKLMEPGAISASDAVVQVANGAKGQDATRAIVGVSPITIKPDDFFGKAQAEAVQEYLRRVGHAAPLDEIFEALRKGGSRLQGKDPKKNLYISLSRRKDIFALVGPYTFGLWEFYPGAKEKTKGEGHISAQLVEVMQDHKVHRIAELLRLLEEKYGRKFVRSTVATTLRRGKEFRKVRRGAYKFAGT
jgi:hypothetical protein